MTPQDDLRELHARVCQALADPKRLCIIDALRDGPMSVGEIAAAVGMSQPNTSQHLAVLRSRGLLTRTRSGAVIHYSLRSRKIVDAVDLLREFMSDVLTGDETDVDALEVRVAAADH